jgi:hypothetical protein
VVDARIGVLGEVSVFTPTHMPLPRHLRRPRAAATSQQREEAKGRRGRLVRAEESPLLAQSAPLMRL